MKLLMKILFLCLVAGFLIGCGGSHCLSVDGRWQEINGKIEYCWNQDATTIRPILANEQGEAVLLQKQDVEMLIKQGAAVSAQGLSLDQMTRKLLEKK